MLTQTIHASAHSVPQVADKSVHAIITSPPYFGLRSYAGDQAVEWPAVDYYPMTGLKEAGMAPLSVPAMLSPLGNEPTIEAFIGHLVLCLREWWRILRDDGCCLVNLGDSYANDRKWGGTTGGKHVNGLHGDTGIGRRKVKTGLKAKDLMMVPARFALAAQADGWTLRSDIIWAKGVSFLDDYAGSSMPESVQDRPSKSHEYIYLLTKGPRYYWDKEAVKEPATVGYNGSRFDSGKSEAARRELSPVGTSERQNQGGEGGRNLRTVWIINPGSYPDAHFATYPETLVEPMIKATTSARGCCPICGAQWRRIAERGQPSLDAGRPQAKRAARLFAERGLTNAHLIAIRAVGCADAGKAQQTMNGFGANTPEMQNLADEAKKALGGYYREFLSGPSVTTGWEPSCACVAGDPAPCVVVDPFVGSGTTLRCAARLGRHGIGIDISHEYLENLVPARVAGTQIEMGF